MDIADKSVELQETLNSTAVAMHTNRTLTVKDSADECVECGYQIPSARQIAVPGCERCVDCAEYVERSN